MNKIFTITIIFLLSILTGCGSKNISSKQNSILLTVDFHDNQTLKYKFQTEREAIINWSPGSNFIDDNASVLNKTIERLDLVMSYKPLEIEPFGLSTIEVTCEEVKVSRSYGAPKDAVEYLAGKSYTLKVDSSGKIHDYSELEELIKEVGQKAFSSGSGSNRIKESDMLGDFIATQWFLWDSISSIPKPAQGVDVGQTWKSKLSVPTPMVSRLARDVTYKLDEVQQDKNIAVINSTYKKTGSVPKNWPVPYTGSFQVRGTFGFLGGYKFIDLAGEGQELFNIDLGQTEEYNQQYSMFIEASIPIGINVNPVIRVKQKISMKLIEE